MGGREERETMRKDALEKKWINKCSNPLFPL